MSKTTSPTAFSSCWGWAIAGSLGAALLTSCGVPVGVISPARRPSTAGAATAITTLHATILATHTVTVLRLPGTMPEPLVDTPALTVGDDGAETVWRGYLTFDLAAIPSTARVESAELVLTSAGNAGGRAVSSSGQVVPVIGAWRPAELRWDRQPPVAEDAAIKVVLHRNKADERVDVTPLVEAWVTGQLDNHGLRLEVTSGNPFWKAWVGATPTEATLAPRLEVHYTAPVVVPASEPARP